MHKTLTILALPVVTLALFAVLLSSQSSISAVPASTTSDIRHVDAGAPIAITQTNWTETGDGSTIVPTSPSGRPKR